MERYVKKFESFVNEINMSSSNVFSQFGSFDKFRHWMINNQNYETSDLIAVLVEDDFVEQEDGSYKKEYKLQSNVMKITPDKQSYNALAGMQMRKQFQNNEILFVLHWVSKDIADNMVEEIKRGGEEGQFMLKTLVGHFLEQNPRMKKGR
jgi:hypothetical protein